MAKNHPYENVAPETFISNECTRESKVYESAFLTYKVDLNKKLFEGLSQFEIMNKTANGG